MPKVPLKQPAFGGRGGGGAEQRQSASGSAPGRTCASSPRGAPTLRHHEGTSRQGAAGYHYDQHQKVPSKLLLPF